MLITHSFTPLDCDELSGEERSRVECSQTEMRGTKTSRDEMSRGESSCAVNNS